MAWPALPYICAPDTRLPGRCRRLRLCRSALAADELGYIIPEYDFRADEYEESMSQGPATAPIVRETAIRMLTGVK